MISSPIWFTLYKLAMLGAIAEPIEISTSRLADATGSSQQTASRHLIILERLGYIERQKYGKHELIRITKEGKKVLEEVYLGLEMALKGRFPERDIVGIVFTGLGEGAYYVSRPQYVKQFVHKLGFKPYPGTLNLRLVSPPTRSFLEKYRHIEITGFQNLDRTYGGAKCYPVKINNKLEGAIIVADRTHYGFNIIEVISPYYLRNALNLKDGDKVKLTLKTRTW